MKQNILAAVAVIVSAGALAQGTLNMSTTPSAIGSAQPVLVGGVNASGADGFSGQLWVGKTETSLAPIGIKSPFLTGGGAGYWRDTSTTVTPLDLGGSGFAALQVFNTAGESFVGPVFAVTAGGQGAPPALPGNLVNFKGFTASFGVIPEPSTIALGFLGAAALLFFRRK